MRESSVLDLAPCSDVNKPRRMARYSEEKSASETKEENPVVVEAAPSDALAIEERSEEQVIEEEEEEDVSNKKRFRFREDSMEDESIEEEDALSFQEIDEQDIFETYKVGGHGLMAKMKSGEEVSDRLKVFLDETDDLGFDPATCKRQPKPLKRFCYRQ